MKARHEFVNETEYFQYLRTYFAAIAMQGLLSCPVDIPIKGVDTKSVSAMSVLMADALIKALNE